MSYSRTIISVIIFLLSQAAGRAVAAGSDGYVPVRNFTIKDYSGNAQNWGCVEDGLGRVYVANGYGMLCHDGSIWRLYHLPNYTSVRALFYDEEKGRIYAAGSGEFGYFSPTGPGRDLRYTSLSAHLGELHPALTEIWKIVRTDGRIWFQGDYHFFSYDGSKLTAYDSKDRIARFSGIAGKIYVAFDNGSIACMDNGEMHYLRGTEALAGLKITAMLPYGGKNRILIGTSVDGLFLYDGVRAERFDSDINAFLKKNQLFCASAQGDNYVFGTVNRGAVVRNFASGRIEYINKEAGLQNNTVLAADFDRNGNLWLSLDYGLGYAVYNTRMWSLTGVSGPIGAGYASMVKNGRIFLGTNQGLFVAPYPFMPSPSPAKFDQQLQGQVWSINDSGNAVFVGSDAGAYAGDGEGHFYQIAGLGGTTRVRVLKGSEKRALALTYQGFYLLGNDSGRWMALGRVDGYDDIAADFVQDRFGDIWLAHWRKGVFRLRFNDKTVSFDHSRLFDHDSGLPADKNTSLALYRDRVVVSTEGGFYYFNAKNEDMQPCRDVTDIFGDAVRGSFRVLGDSVLAVIDSHGISTAMLGRDGKFKVDTTSLRNIGNRLIPGYTDLYMADDGKLLLSGYEGFWNINPHHVSENVAEGSVGATPFVSAVTANGDSLVYRATVESADDGVRSLKVPYDLNTLRFNFGCAYFGSPDGIEYSSYLEGYDDGPSDFSDAKSREYTKIPDGVYKFRLTARNLHTGSVETTVLKVVVASPWYSTIIARIVWVLLFMLACAGIYFVVAERVKRSRKALEKRKEEEFAALEMKTRHESMVKDMEIATLRSEHLEQDIQHKSRELCDTTQNLIQKNEVLQDISARLKHIGELLSTDLGVAAAQRKLEKIRQIIDYNLSHDNDWTRFSSNFDVVYSNFTKRLMELHPNLSVADKRLCCYIRMGLSSKEIAPLINISNKSVEMARYRVRKKIGLEPGDSLTSYLNSL